MKPTDGYAKIAVLIAYASDKIFFTQFDKKSNMKLKIEKYSPKQRE